MSYGSLVDCDGQRWDSVGLTDAIVPVIPTRYMPFRTGMTR